MSTKHKILIEAKKKSTEAVQKKKSFFLSIVYKNIKWLKQADKVSKILKKTKKGLDDKEIS